MEARSSFFGDQCCLLVSTLFLFVLAQIFERIFLLWNPTERRTAHAMFYHLWFSLIHLLMNQMPLIHFEFRLYKWAETARSKYTRKKRLQISHNPCLFHALWFKSYWSIPLEMKLFRLLYSILSQIPRKVFGTTTGSFIVFHFVSFARWLFNLRLVWRNYQGNNW